MDLFGFQKNIGKNITYFIQLKGYTISSLARLTTIPKTELEQILRGEVTNPIIYQEQIMQLTKSLNLPNDYFLQDKPETPEKWQLFSQGSTFSARSQLAQELLDDLDELISIAHLYIRNSDD